MATLFQQSSLTFTQAQQKVASAAGAKSDTDMLALAGDAVVWAFQRWNNAFQWPWLLKTTTINIPSPFTLAGCSGTGGQASIATVNDFTTPNLVLPGDYVALGVGTDIFFLLETRVLTVSNNLITITNPLRANLSSATLIFDRNDIALPSDFGRMYDIRMMGSPKALIYTARRDYDIVRPLNTPSTPSHYSLTFRGGADGAGGFLTLLPPPSSTSQFIMTYYRRLTQPVSGSDVLDIPQDYEVYVLAMAKSHFLADKGGQEARMAFWGGLAEAGLKRAISLAGPPPDDRAGFQPDMGSLSPSWNPNARVDPSWTV